MVSALADDGNANAHITAAMAVIDEGEPESRIF
jgi:hypothetical protein